MPDKKELEIRPIEAGDIADLDRLLPPHTPGRHRSHLARQERDEVVYLVAWLEGEPAGHLVLSWRRPNPEEVGWSLDAPHISEFSVRPELQSRGIGSAMLLEAERIVAEAGKHSVALSVDQTNERAIRLYERHGYVRVESPFEHTYEMFDPNGRFHINRETCIDMVKRLHRGS